MIDPQFEHYLREQPGLSYASSDQPWVTRQVTRSIERGLGRRRLEAHYFALKAQGLSSQVFFQEALLRSGIELRTDFSPLEQIRPGRPLLFLANHPFGIVDGLVMCNIALKVASNFRVVINSLLCQDRDLAQHFLPIDFSGSRAAERRNVRHRLDSEQTGIWHRKGKPLDNLCGKIDSATHTYGRPSIFSWP